MRSSFKRLKDKARKIVNFLGIDIYRTEEVTLGGFVYEPVRPLTATYAPWKMDRPFQEIYAAVQGSTYVDKYRCFELWTLVEQSRKLRGGALIEVGVWRGGSGALIAHKAKNVGIKEPVYLCDTFSGVVKAGTEDLTFYKGGEHADTSREVVRQLVQDRLGLDNVIILSGIFPDESAHLIADLQFRFCHIDVDTYQSAKDVVEWIWPKMVRGGIIIFDDYGFKYCEGVTKYVEELRDLADRLLIHNLNGHAILVKTCE
jgi:O-methyltransferase